MKRIVMSALISVMMAAGVSAQAQSLSVKQSPQQMEKLDSNKDGQVSREEYQTFMEASFDRLDANKDGVLERSEFPPVVTDEQFAAMDVNGNGKITKAEFMQQVMTDFDQAAR